jgi:hypothetical protein
MLLHFYAVWAWPSKAKVDAEQGRPNGTLNGHPRAPDRTVQDAEEFELTGLMSDDESAETPSKERHDT